jgi:hypothetical protein
MKYERRQCSGSGSVGYIFLGLPDPHPDPLVMSTDPPFSHKSVERTEKGLRSKILIQKFSCKIFYSNYQTFIYNLEPFEFHI